MTAEVGAFWIYFGLGVGLLCIVVVGLLVWINSR